MSRKRILDSCALLAYLHPRTGAQHRQGRILHPYHTVLPDLPITTISNTFQDIIEAAKIKATHPLSYADCFAIQTSLKENAPIITGDPEFKKADKKVGTWSVNTNCIT